MSNETILIVDDNTDNLAVLGQLLEYAGYKVRPANSGKLALMSLQQDPADLILLDVRMPNMNGYEVCRALKENPKTSNIPVIFLSALSEAADKIEAFESGGVDYVSKPFNEAEVLARVKTHLQLHKLQRHLEAEVMRRTIDLSEANAGLEKALAAKGEFLSLMRHEFRTPLNGILGMVDMLKEEASNEQREYVEIIEISGWRLFKLVDDILLMTEASTPDFSLTARPPEPLQLKQLCQTILDDIKVLVEQKHITTDLQAENIPLLNTPLSTSRLRHIIDNLLDNAIKFTPEKGQIGIQVHYLADCQQLLIKVWDTGSGIPLKDRDRIFEPFVQLEPLLSRRHEGPGLGLTLARNLVRLHGGNIAVMNRQEGGSIFQVTIPAQEYAF